MNKLIEELIDKGLGRFMEASRDSLAQTDDIYQNDCKDASWLERQYEKLDLTQEQKMLIDDYMACNSTVSHRYADISYMCGIKDTVSMLASLGLIKDVEAEA